MVRQRSVGDDLAFAVAFERLVTQLRMAAFLFVVDGFADVVQQTTATTEFGIEAHVGSHRAAEERDLLRMLQHILPVAGAPLELAQQTQDLRM